MCSGLDRTVIGHGSDMETHHYDCRRRPRSGDAFLVFVLDVPIVRHRLLIMAALAQGLPIFYVPEQFRVTTVWFDMVHHCCRRQNTFCLAADTPGMPTEKPCPRLLPSPVVATLRRCLSIVPMFFGMLLAVLLPIRYEPWTSGMCARRLRSVRHQIISFDMAGTAGFEPTPTVLETVVLPLHHAPIKKAPADFSTRACIFFAFSL